MKKELKKTFKIQENYGKYDEKSFSGKKSILCKSNVYVNALNDHFINTPIDLSNSFANNDIFEDLQPLSDKTFSLPTVSEDKILAHINNMDSKKSIGCDGISSKLLKISSLVFIPIIAFLIDLSFKSLTVPMLWKTAYVKALIKGGKKSDFNNYRPISILPIISKII